MPPRERGGGLPGLPLLLLPSGQGNLLLRALAPEASQALTSPRLAPTRKKMTSKPLVLLVLLQFLQFHLVSHLLFSEPVPSQDSGPESGKESQGPVGYP